jgi:hypothetical protein
MTATVQTMTIAVDPRVGERWIRGTTTASVLLLAGIAAVVSYGHMHMLTVVHGESAWTAALIPLSVDGMIVASSMTLLADSRAGRSGGVLPWALLAAGSAASLAANVAAAEPTAYGRVIAAWPSFALIGAYELLMRQIRSQATTADHAAVRAATAGSDPTPPAGDHQSPTRPVLSSSGPVNWPDANRVQPRDTAAPATRGLDTDLISCARQINAEHWSRTGRPASAETLRIQLRVGAATARALKDHVRHDIAPDR